MVGPSIGGMTHDRCCIAHFIDDADVWTRTESDARLLAAALENALLAV